jgi:hypothetical protein
MLNSAPNRPAQRASFDRFESSATFADDHTTATADDPGGFVGWVYRCLHVKSKSGTPELHDALTLRTFVEPDEALLSRAWWDKSFKD